MSTLLGKMRSHLDTSTETKCPVATSPSMQWQSMPKTNMRPTFATWAQQGITTILHHQQRQCSPRHLPEPRLPLHSAYTRPSTICSWNPLSEMWNWRQFGSESSNMLKHAKRFWWISEKICQKFLWPTASEDFKNQNLEHLKLNGDGYLLAKGPNTRNHRYYSRAVCSGNSNIHNTSTNMLYIIYYLDLYSHHVTLPINILYDVA